MVLPTPVPASGHVELTALSVLSVLLLIFAITQGRRIVRTEDAILLMLWVSFVAFGFLGLGR